jgi:hypothetical protein
MHHKISILGTSGQYYSSIAKESSGRLSDSIIKLCKVKPRGIPDWTNKALKNKHLGAYLNGLIKYCKINPWGMGRQD